MTDDQWAGLSLAELLAAREALDAKWGASVSGGGDDGTGKPFRRWKLPNGWLYMNDERYRHPLQWSAVVWDDQ